MRFRPSILLLVGPILTAYGTFNSAKADGDITPAEWLEIVLSGLKALPDFPAIDSDTQVRALAELLDEVADSGAMTADGAEQIGRRLLEILDIPIVEVEP